jgi:hypothetical protein
MGVIRKISIGPDYKGGAMHYLVGQDVLSGVATIEHINVDNDGSIKVWVRKGGEIFLWKKFTSTMPISIEYDISF